MTELAHTMPRSFAQPLEQRLEAALANGVHAYARDVGTGEIWIGPRHCVLAGSSVATNITGADGGVGQTTRSASLP